MSTEPEIQPPRLPLRFLEWYCKDDLLEEIEGDLYQEYQERYTRNRLTANSLYVWQVLSFFRPFALKRFTDLIPNNMMLKHYTKIAWRVTLRNRGYAAINIGGLAVGMAVALLIGLWIHSEYTFNQYHDTYPRMTQVMSYEVYNDEAETNDVHTTGLPTAIREKYGSHFDGIASARRPGDMIIGRPDQDQIRVTGQFVGEEMPRMLALVMQSGSYEKFGGKNTILLSESTAKKLFGAEDPVGQDMIFNGDWDVTVVGVYEDLPKQSTFHGRGFFVPLPILLDLYGTDEYAWDNYFLECYALLKPDRDAAQVSALIEEVSHPFLDIDDMADAPRTFLEPMPLWHLNSAFEGHHRITSARMRFVYLYSIIGLFVLLLACINFMNLSTARSEKRAKEVGIRKTIGSVRKQLIQQFLSESILVSVLALVLAIALATLALPWFNRIADKDMQLLWTEPIFWGAILSFTLLTAFLAGSYPALLLSSFRPIRVLKGAYQSARSAVWGRRALVVTQFSISILLFVGTLVVYKQIQFAKDREAGYEYDGLVMIQMRSDDIDRNYRVMQDAW
ncbi:MAG TPA: ABC transporter permease, partial [Cytophagales bacterium]|nr:ABC transporter permease [Cytophagales bacterium]